MNVTSNISSLPPEPSTNKPIDLDDILNELNASEVRSLLPLILFYSTILTIGVIGNALVLLVYTFRYKRSPARVFILFLASIDFSICLFGLPYHLIDLTHPYTFTNRLTCKLLTFVITTLFHMSVFGLIVISIDRYLKICMPLSHLQLSFFTKRRACGVAGGAAVLLSWPNIVLYGPSSMETAVDNVTGYACYYEDQYLETHYPLIHTVTILLVCVSCTLFLIVAYSLIYIRIYKRYYGFKGDILSKFATDDLSCTEDDALEPINRPAHKLNVQKARHTISSTRKRQLESTIRSYLGGNSWKGGNGSVLNPAVPNDTTGLTAHLANDTYDKHKTQDDLHNGDALELKSKSDNRINETTYTNVTPRSSVTVENNGTSITGKLLDPLNHERAASVNISNACDGCDGVMSGESHPTLQPISTCLKPTCGPIHGSTSSVETTTPAGSSAAIIQNHHVGKRSMDSGQSTEGLYNIHRGGFPMCRPQQVKRRSLDNLTHKAFLRHCHQKSISLGHIPGSVYAPDGLRINRGSSTRLNPNILKANDKQHNPANHSKITKIMLTITVVFILSYSPALIVTIISVIKPEIWDIMTVQETIVCEFFLRLYLVNNVCNPFIYGFWDKRFLREIRIAFKKLIGRITDFCCCKKY